MEAMAHYDNKQINEIAFHKFKNKGRINHDRDNVKYVHSVKLEEESLLYKIIGKDSIRVNSHHMNNIGKKLNTYKACGHATDGIIEYIESPYHEFAIGVQWHPELMESYDLDQEKIFEYFIKMCKGGK